MTCSALSLNLSLLAAFTTFSLRNNYYLWPPSLALSDCIHDGLRLRLRLRIVISQRPGSRFRNNQG
jgi:hypothetical protein